MTVFSHRHLANILVLTLTMTGALLLTACNTSQVRSTSVTPLLQNQQHINEALLMDVGVELFDPGLENIEEDDITAYPEVRQAEARYLPATVVNTLQSSGNWGAVRIIPKETTTVDVTVAGTILASTGEQLKLDITVTDASGKQWYQRQYQGQTSKFSYEAKQALTSDPFQDVYNRIANDLVAYKNALAPEQIRTVRSIAELRFAQSFAPDAFGGYLDTDGKGRYHIKRLPAETDPMLVRIRKIRDRDYLFIDTLQDYYGAFTRQMSGPYQEWRQQSYEEVMAYQELKRESHLRTAAGIAAIIAGIAMAGNDNGYTRNAGIVSAIGGGYLIKTAMDKHVEAELHAEALKELGGSLGAEITPQMIELDDRTVTLSGTVTDQYQQWRTILLDIYASEVGDVKMDSNAP